MADESLTQRDLLELKLEFEKKLSEAREYTVQQSHKARNEALSILTALAILLTVGGWIGLDHIMQQKVDRATTVQALSAANNRANKILELLEATETEARQIRSQMGEHLKDSQAGKYVRNEDRIVLSMPAHRGMLFSLSPPNNARINTSKVGPHEIFLIRKLEE